MKLPRPAALTDADVLAAVTEGRVTGEASTWWLDGWRRVNASIRRLQHRRLVADAIPPPCGKITAVLAAQTDTPTQKGTSR